jgi:hypothetical protein
MTQQKTSWFVQYKDNGEIIVVKRIICCLNPFTTTTKFFISIQVLFTGRTARPFSSDAQCPFHDALCLFHDAMPFFKVYMSFLIKFFLQTSVTFGHCDRNKTTYVKFVYLMSFNHFQLARVNQLLQITYGQSAVFLNGQGKQVE